MMLSEPTVEDQTAGKKIISVITAIAITTSTALVMALIAVNIETKTEAELIAKVVTATKAAKPKIEKKSIQKMAKQASASSASAMSTKMIRANTNAVITMPKLTVVNNEIMGIGEGDFGDGFGGGNGNGTGGVGSMKGVGRRIGGMTIKAEKLGVVLDVSGSMTDHLEKLRKDIKKEFKDAVFREVTGCRLDANSGNIEELDPDSVARRSVLEAMRKLVELKKVDAIFWFCDLKDGESEEGLNELANSFWHGDPPPLLKEGEKKPTFGGLDELARLQDRQKAMANENAPIRLYVRSVGKKPEKPLKKFISDSGGSFKRQ
ncbi:hypothetical protein OAE56_03135 [Verrucomicrobiales bacterium]|nr:hypothetical protein [Verrucomicrobiales bacterium]MDC0276071.1 hypothetical protein [Verrucomicrobiales bacterium]